MTIGYEFQPPSRGELANAILIQRFGDEESRERMEDVCMSLKTSDVVLPKIREYVATNGRAVPEIYLEEDDGFRSMIGAVEVDWATEVQPRVNFAFEYNYAVQFRKFLDTLDSI